MDETGAAELLPADKADKRYLTAREAAFIGVGAMVDHRARPVPPDAKA
jgi:hypothetical protein